MYGQVLDQCKERTAVLNLGSVLRSLNRLEEGLEHYQRWLPHFPEDVQLVANAANCCLDLKQPELALAWITPCLQHSGADPRLRGLQAKALINCSRSTEAVPILQALDRFRPDDPGTLRDLATAYLQLEQPELALGFLQRLPECELNSSTQLLAVVAYRKLGQLDQARKVLDGIPCDEQKHGQWQRQNALWLACNGEGARAERCWAALCQTEPQDPSLWLQWSNALRERQMMELPIRVLKQGIQWAPEDTQLQQGLQQALIGRGNWSPALLEAWMSNQMATTTWNLDKLSSFQFLGAGYNLLSSDLLQQAARHWEQQLQAQQPLWRDQIREPLNRRRLRVGYLSADWRWHPVSRFMLPLLKAHNHQQIELWGLNATPNSDETTQQIHKQCDHWIELPRHNPHQAARRIAEQRLDVLVELGGFTSGSALAMLLHRPAPVQLSYLGYFTSTGLNCINGWVGDQTLFNGQATDGVALPGGAMAIDFDAFPAVVERSSAKFRFGCFNHSRKLTTETLDLFAAILNACPAAELLLKSPSFQEQKEQDRILKLGARVGLDCSRVLMEGWCNSHLEHLALYRNVDVALDPTPYSGATTSVDALGMGVPVVALRGATSAGRLSASVLKHAGLSDWITTDKTSYIARAVQAYRQGPRFGEERQRLRTQVRKSDLGSPSRLAIELEQVFIEHIQELDRSELCF